VILLPDLQEKQLRLLFLLPAFYQDNKKGAANLPAPF
jgi:hypothetical protein